MIINCDNCNKKFNLDEKFIPDKGRLLKCSSCGHVWRYFLNKDNFSLDNKISEKQISENIASQEKNQNFYKKVEDKKKNKFQKKIKNKVEKLNENNSNITKKNFFVSYLFVILISFIAFILILDTFKNNLSHYIPSLIPILDNLYQSLNDIFLFIKDLFN